MKIFPAIAATLILSGCGAPYRHTAITRHDLGIAPQTAGAALPVSLQLLPVNAPPWINSRDINYRLAYKHNDIIAAYTESAWIAPPPELLALRLHNASPDRLLTPDKPPSHTLCTLQVDLENFEQVFDAPNTSNAFVALHVTLSSRKSRELVAQASIHNTTIAPSPDARGGSAALAAACDTAVQQTLRWLQQTFDADSDEGRKHIAMCTD